MYKPDNIMNFTYNKLTSIRTLDLVKISVNQCIHYVIISTVLVLYTQKKVGGHFSVPTVL